MRLRSGLFIPIKFNFISAGKSKRRGPVEGLRRFLVRNRFACLSLASIGPKELQIVDCRLEICKGVILNKVKKL